MSNEENKLVENLGAITEWLKTSLEKTGNFAAEQTPLAAQEYLNYAFAYHVFDIITGLLFGLIVISNFILAVKRVKNWEDCDININHITTIVCGILSFTFLIVFVHNTLPSIKQCMKIKMAPRIYVLEKVKELVK